MCPTKSPFLFLLSWRKSRKSRVPFTPEAPVVGKKRARRNAATEEASAEPDKWLKYVQQVQAQLAKVSWLGLHVLLLSPGTEIGNIGHMCGHRFALR
jgi:hypothetical protein